MIGVSARHAPSRPEIVIPSLFHASVKTHSPTIPRTHLFSTPVVIQQKQDDENGRILRRPLGHFANNDQNSTSSIRQSRPVSIRCATHTVPILVDLKSLWPSLSKTPPTHATQSTNFPSPRNPSLFMTMTMVPKLYPNVEIRPKLPDLNLERSSWARVKNGNGRSSKDPFLTRVPTAGSANPRPVASRITGPEVRKGDGVADPHVSQVARHCGRELVASSPRKFSIHLPRFPPP